MRVTFRAPPQRGTFWAARHEEAKVMRVRLVVTVGCVLLLLPMSTAEALVLRENAVIGTGALPDLSINEISVDARTDPSGAHPRGFVSMLVRGGTRVRGPVTCVSIDGNRAIVGFDDTVSGLGPHTVEIVDNEGTGAPDTFFGDRVPTDCTDDPVLGLGGELGQGDLTVLSKAVVPRTDSVIGYGAPGGFITDVSIDVRSEPSGANLRGFVSFNVLGGIRVRGLATCLAIDGNRAVIGVDDELFHGITVEVFDNEATGAPDTFFVDPAPTGCTGDPAPTTGGPFSSGDLVVDDVLVPSSADQCRRGGWRDLTDDRGLPFQNQIVCIQFVED
jgi:hypothetical protein